jgi:hypothetical protein
MGYSLQALARGWSGRNIEQFQAKGYGLINCRSGLFASPAVREEIRDLVLAGTRRGSVSTTEPSDQDKETP